MLQIQVIRENPSYVIERLKVKNFDATELINNILEIDTQIRQTKKTLDNNLMEQGKLAKSIGQLFKEGKRDEAEAMKAQTAQLKADEKALQTELADKDRKINELMVLLPNMPHTSVPCGKGAKMQRALINFFLDSASEHGYREVEPPYVVNEASAYATGQLPDKEAQMYHVDLDNLYLIPTAEVPVTNIYRDTILKASDFPIKNCAYSACFRREAGSYGKDVRGLNRLHQFDKVEIVQVEHPDKSYETLEEMKQYGMSLLQRLGLPFRVLRLCGGDISFTSALTYDLEVFSRAQEKWLEVSSISNFESYQANRLKLRFKDENGKMRLAHTLNGSALALPRVMAAIIENYQTPEGIVVPEVLRPYTHFDIID